MEEHGRSAEGHGRALWRELAAVEATNSDVAGYTGVDISTVRRWRSAARVSNPSRYSKALRELISDLADDEREDHEQDLRIDLRQMMATASSLLNRLRTLTADELLSAVVGRLACADANIRLTVAPAFRGRASRILELPLHYLVGVEILDGDPKAGVLPGTSSGLKPPQYVLNTVATTLKQEWLELGLHLRHGAPQEFATDPQTLVLQVPIIERPHVAAVANRIHNSALKDRIVIVAPVYGYGEMLAALLSEALGMTLADLRYEEGPPPPSAVGSSSSLREVRRAARRERERRGVDLLGKGTRNTAWCVAGKTLLAALEHDIERAAPTTTVIAIRYGRAWAKLGKAVHLTPVGDQIANGAAAVTFAERLKSGAIVIDYHDDDVLDATRTEADVDRIADQTMVTAIEILDRLGVEESTWQPGWLKTTADQQRPLFDSLRRQSRERRTTVTLID